jgi:hypothetical protein
MIDIVREMAKEIHAQVGNLVPRELASELNGIAETSNRVTEKELPARFLRVSKYLDESLIQVLLFDSVTLALGDLFEQIERDLLEPILMNRRAVIVTASRAPIYWKRFECRRRVIDKEVLPFDKQAMREQLDKWGIPDLTEAVYTYSFGYPERTELLAETFRNSLVDSLHSMEQRLIEGIPSEAQTILGLITPLRRFRVESLAELARILLGDMHERKPTGYYLNVLRTLHETGLVEWRRDYRAYATNDLFRKIVNTRLRMTDHQRYITLHEASLRIYLEWISEYPRNSSEFIAEALFHLAILYKDTDKAKFLNGINRRLEDIGALPSEERKAIYSQLTDDRELAEALGVEQYSRILSTCQSGMND